jgi:hypothetical protein
MKLNHWLLLPSLVMVASGCATNYHGPQSSENQKHLPPALWDNTINTQDNIPGPLMGWQMPDDRKYIPVD